MAIYTGFWNHDYMGAFSAGLGYVLHNTKVIFPTPGSPSANTLYASLPSCLLQTSRIPIIDSRLLKEIS